MNKRKQSSKTGADSTANLGFEAKLWLTADKLRNTTIQLTAASKGEKPHRSGDLLGRVYEYFLTRFASTEGKNFGQFYTPSCVVRCLVEMLVTYKRRIYDPCCGSGGMFVQSEKFVESHGGKLGDISIYGQDNNAT